MSLLPTGERPLAELSYFPTKDAVLCESCGCISNARVVCPNCASPNHIFHLQPLLNPDECTALTGEQKQ